MKSNKSFDFFIIVKFISAGFASVLLLGMFAPVVEGDTAITVVTQVITGGSLQITSLPNATLTPLSVNAASAQTSTGSLGTLTVTDSRGTGAGWSTTVTATNFTGVSPVTRISGSNSTVTSSGTFTGSSGGIYTMTIVNGGSAGVATFSVSGLESQTTTLTGSNVSVGTKGVKLTFGAAGYISGDSWTVRGDVIPVTGLTITPKTITTISGSSTGVTAGPAHLFSGESDPSTIFVASSGNGMGSYSQNPDLSLLVPVNTMANVYTSTITETIQ